MENEFYYRQELLNKIDDFISEQLMIDNDFGWIGENLARHMADAAWAVLMSSKDVQDFLKREGELKS